MIYERFTRVARERPMRPALSAGPLEFTYGDFLKIVNGWCKWLATFAGGDDRIAILGADSLDNLCLCLAASRLRCGAVLLQDVEQVRLDGLPRAVDDAAPDWLIVSDGADHPDLPFPPERRREKPALSQLASAPFGDPPIALEDRTDLPLIQMCTSGTTGSPKGVCVSETAVITAVANICEAMRLDDESRFLFKNNHRGNTLVGIASLLAGATLVLPRSESAKDVCSLIEANRITHLILLPVEIDEALTDDALPTRRLDSLRCLGYGAAPMPPALLKRARAALPQHCRWLQGYGSTETCGPVAWLHEEDHRDGRALTCGRPSRFHQIRIVDAAGREAPPGAIGQVFVRGDTLMEGYWDRESGRPKPFGADGWLSTGDVGSLDEDGFLTILGRVEDTIRTTNGSKFFCAEVERVLTPMDGVYEAALIPWENGPHAGDVPVVVLRTTNGFSNAETVLRACRHRLSPEKQPRYILLSKQALPRTSRGKLDRQVLVDAVAHALRPDSGASGFEIVYQDRVR